MQQYSTVPSHTATSTAWVPSSCFSPEFQTACTCADPSAVQAPFPRSPPPLLTWCPRNRACCPALSSRGLHEHLTRAPPLTSAARADGAVASGPFLVGLSIGKCTENPPLEPFITSSRPSMMLISATALSLYSRGFVPSGLWACARCSAALQRYAAEMSESESSSWCSNRSKRRPMCCRTHPGSWRQDHHHHVLEPYDAHAR
jgi:hypothetical protein